MLTCCPIPQLVYCIYSVYELLTYWEIFEVKFFCCFNGFAHNLENLITQKFLYDNKWLEIFAPQTFPNSYRTWENIGGVKPIGKWANLN